jgi:hypothetical protein
MAEDAAVVDAPVVEPQAVVEPQVVDPFSLDENQLASLSPEQRAAVEPIIDGWKKRASEEIEKTKKGTEEQYKPHLEKATALDRLTADPRFQQWYQSLQKQAMQGQTPQTQQAIAQTQPQHVATPQEWSEAVAEAYQGDPSKFQALQQRAFGLMAAPVVQQIQNEQQMLRTQMEMKDLFARHPDAADLDLIGRDPKNPSDQSPSVLELAMYYVVDQRGGTLEQAYELAKKYSGSMGVKAQQQAMGMVQEKKGSVTAGPGSSNAGSDMVVYVDNQDELLQKSMQADLEGKKNLKFVIKGKS